MAPEPCSARGRRLLSHRLLPVLFLTLQSMARWEPLGAVGRPGFLGLDYRLLPCRTLTGSWALIRFHPQGQHSQPSDTASFRGRNQEVVLAPPKLSSEHPAEGQPRLHPWALSFPLRSACEGVLGLKGSSFNHGAPGSPWQWEEQWPSRGLWWGRDPGEEQVWGFHQLTASL